jgi:hypothetical protein
MPNPDPRIDAYIAGKPDFARPILAHLRAAVHRACPEVEEGVRWSMPSFSYRGKILCQMAAFNAHATFGFWQGRAVTGATEQPSAMGQFGRLTGLDDLPPDAEIDALIYKAMALVDRGASVPRPPKHAKPELTMPDYLAAALRDNPAAQTTYDAFPPSCRRDYVEWVVEAKRPETRAKRVAEAVGWMAEGKRRNWKYEKC